MSKVSICIPTFNRVSLLPFAIESVLSQSYQNWELIICDDGSQDGTDELMSKYEDNRIKYIRHHQNIGKSNNMRSGFDAATGEYFIKFDDDDKLTDCFLEKTVAILAGDKNLDFVSTDHWIIDINNIRNQEQTEVNSQRWGRKNLSAGLTNNLLEKVFIQQCFQIGATLFRRAALAELNFMRSNWQNCEDNDLFVRLALAGKKGYYLPERLMEYRVHPEQQGINRALPYLRDKITYLESYKFENHQLENIRKYRLLETQLLLGLRLIEKGENPEGRKLILAANKFSPLKAWSGLILSLVPMALRKNCFELVRSVQR